MENIRIFKYNNFIRFVFILFNLFIIFIIFIGLLLLMEPNLFANIVSCLVVIFLVINTIDVLFFKALEFHDDFLIKRWFVLGEKQIKYEYLRVAVSKKRGWNGLISFSNKNKGFFSNLFMSLATFLIGNEDFREIRNILIEKKLIQRDKYGLDY